MKAVQINTYGDNNVLEINYNAPKPKAAKNQILVEVHDASINPFDKFMREGYIKDLQFPITIGGDFSGIVTEIGEEVTDFKPGDQIYGQAIILNGSSGAFAKYAVVNINNTAQKPANTSFEEASALPLVGSSAIQALEDYIMLQNKQKILIHGGAGGIGQNTQTNKNHLDRLRKYVEQNKIKVHIDKVFPLAQVREAFDYQTNGHPRGKVVLKIKE